MEKGKILTMVSFILWEIWKARCADRDQQLSPMFALRNAMDLMNEYVSVHRSIRPAINPPATKHLWEPHKPPFVKVNTDAAWNSTSGVAGLGVIIRDEKRAFCGGAAKAISSLSTLAAEENKTLVLRSQLV